MNERFARCVQTDKKATDKKGTNMNNDTLEELGASAKSVEEMRKTMKKSYGNVGKVFWEIRRKGMAKRKEVFEALRAEGVKFGGRVSSALWKLADDLQTSVEWTDAMTAQADAVAREAASAEGRKKKGGKDKYEKALDALEGIKELVAGDSDTLEALDVLAMAVDRARQERAAMLEALADTAKASKAETAKTAKADTAKASKAETAKAA